jgi:nucleotide-binding universal stress UspA family protein
LVICVAGRDLALPAAQALAQTANNRIQSYFPQWELSSEGFSGRPAEVILKTCSWWRPDLMIIGADAFPIERSSTSSVSLEVVHRAQCSVRMTRTGVPAAAGPVRLLIGSNGSKACEAVVQEVARRNWPENTETHVISVVEEVAAEAGEQEQTRLRALDETCIHQLRGAGLTVNRRIVDGDPRHELLRESERYNVDAIFIGPRILREMGRFLLGSVATAVVTRARSTVEVVRQN